MPLYYPVQALGVSTGGNTLGNTGTKMGTGVLVGGSNITLSQVTGAGGATITISGGAGGGAGLASAGVSSQGNTAGSTGFGSTLLQLAATNLLTLSQSTDAGGGATVTMVAPRIPTLQRFENLPGVENGAAYSSLGTINGSMQLFPLAGLNDIFPANMTVSTVFFDMSGSNTNTTVSAAQTFRVSVGLYTLAGASTLSLLNSGTASVTAAGASSQTISWIGPRYLTMVNSQFSGSSLTLSQTSYWMGVIVSSSGGTAGLSWLGGYLGNSNANRSGTMGVSGLSANSRGFDPWTGIVGTAALPTSIHISNITKTGSAGGFVPHVVLEAMHSAW